MENEIVIPLAPLEGYPCVYCYGFGVQQGDRLIISDTEVRYRPGSLCAFCKGTGRVQVVPLDKK